MNPASTSVEPEPLSQITSSSRSGPWTTNLLQTLDLRPLAGRLQHLRTKAEVLNWGETVEMYYCAVETRDASRVLSIIKTLPNHDAFSLLHLRRFVKPEFLPKHLLSSQLKGAGSCEKSTRVQTTDVKDIPTDQILYVLLVPTSTSSPSTLIAALDSVTTRIDTTQVPLHPPSSPAHAAVLTKSHWPSIFTNNNAFGPHYALVERETQALETNAAIFMALAHDVASKTAVEGCGLAVGVAVVEGNEVVAVAGDGRYLRQHDRSPYVSYEAKRRVSDKGDPSMHAVMRSIALVARKRRAMAASSTKASNSAMAEVLDVGMLTSISSMNQDETLIDLEAEVLAFPNLQPDGYLCQHLTFYITHEPCVMCSMALVHSRADKVVICVRENGDLSQPSLVWEEKGAIAAATPAPDVAVTKKRRTGGLTIDEDGGGYGLFWRSELNWRFMCWAYTCNDSRDTDIGLDDDVHI